MRRRSHHNQSYSSTGASAAKTPSQGRTTPPPLDGLKTEWLIEGSGAEWAWNQPSGMAASTSAPAQGQSADSRWDDEDSLVDGSGSHPFDAEHEHQGAAPISSWSTFNSLTEQEPAPTSIIGHRIDLTGQLPPVRTPITSTRRPTKADTTTPHYGWCTRFTQD